MFNLWKFDYKRPSEKIILMTRRHPIILLKGLFQIIGIIILLFLMFYFIGFNQVTTIILMVGILLAIIIALANLYIWYNDQYTLTDERLIDVDQTNIFARTVTETTLDQIQDVTSEMNGLLPTIFNFGKVAIQTAGVQQNIVIEVVPNPNMVQQSITRAYHDYRARMGFKVNKEEKNE